MKKTTVMTEGTIWKELLKFSIPLILGNLFQQLYNTVDSIIVGNYIGRDALAAVGSSGSLINLLLAFCIGASAGAGVIIAQCYGAGDAKGISQAVHTTLAIAVISGIIMTILGILVTPALLRWMGTPEKVLPQSIQYMRIFFGGITFSVIYNFAAGILNAVGNSGKALQYLIIAAGSNVVLDLLFVVVFHMGVEGVALATDIGQFLSFVFIIHFLVKHDDIYQVRLRDIRIDGYMAKKIIKLGIPTGVQNMVISFSNVLIQSSVNSFGATLMASFAAYTKVDGFNIMPVMSFSMAATTFTGQNVGAGRYDRVKRGMWTAIFMGIGYTLLSMAMILTFGRQIIGVFVTDAEVITLGVYIMKFFCPFYSILATMHILAGAIRGTGKTLPPMFIIIFALCIFRIAWIQLVVNRYHEMKWIFAAYPISWAIGAAMMIVYAWKAKWIPRENAG
ncbi:MATE family efflux transporter [Hespellia stercorisuis]|uniref:Putative efflux protein, MATE family n=1 Tax=Hespellia stercorisuis DSM 15480 TaxID=1121950 RepID=A0A1M6VT92_9FIRM|nr:MATE family efflux transporter [Hespellia stercorisuis]SHK84743.1 putative efflux protein, MATE family [Hespellia stercorisuis DSM 15480]